MELGGSKYRISTFRKTYGKLGWKKVAEDQKISSVNIYT